MNGSASWDSTISSEAAEWLDGLVEHIRERGNQPVWAAVHAKFAELFPKDAPKAANTIATTVRKRLG